MSACKYKYWCATLIIALALGGCATSLPQAPERSSSTAFDKPQETALGRFFQPELAAHPGKTGVAVVTTSEWGFRGRAGLANMAEKTLDLQYYIWEVDTAGAILAERVMRAADRGVRVRMLIDDVNTGNSDFQFARMDNHPNIEIRLYNPFAKRNSRMTEFVFNVDRLNHRMHNKAFIADNAFAIVGGRNIGDDYFGVHTVANFRDLDLALAGPLVQEVSRSFDEFWNSEKAVPVSSLVKEELTRQEFLARKGRLYDWVKNVQDFPYPVDTTSDALFVKLEEELRKNFVWTEARVLFDAPDKPETGEEVVVDQLRQEGRDKKHEVLLEAAYLIPGPRELEVSRLNKERGIRQRVLTNSLATNDVAAAHAGYARYRKQLIRNGVELYELRPDASSDRRKWSLLAGRSKASLHTKAFVVDREKLAIGSFNMDPRSIAINTEIVIVIENPELAARVANYMDTGVLPENSYRVLLEADKDTGRERLVWITEKNGEEVRYYSDPDVGVWRRFSAWFMSLLPIEEHL
jgi:putative cardiolipin synthase